MKLTLAALLAFATLAVYVEANAFELLGTYSKASKTCMSTTGATKDDVKPLTKFQVPESHAAQCYAICVAKKMNFVTADNKVNFAKLKEVTKKFGSKFNKAIETVEQCSNKGIADKDECLLAKKMMTCVKESGLNMGSLMG